MSNYAFRIHSSYESLQSFVKNVSEVSNVLAVYEHPDTNRVHIHGYVEGLTVSTDTLKNWVKKALNVKSFPKSDWEFAEKISKGDKKGQSVDRNSLIYFHKGKYPIKFIKGLSDEFILEQHSKSYKPTEYVGKSIKTQYKLVCENPTQKKMRENDLIMLMIDKYKSTGANDDDVLIECIRNVLTETKTICGLYKFVDYFDTISMRIRPGKFIDDVRNVLMKRKARM